MRSRGSWRVLLISNWRFAIDPTYFTRNSAHVSDVPFPAENHTKTLLTKVHGNNKVSNIRVALTRALGGICIKAGDSAGSGKSSQTGINRLDTGKNWIKTGQGASGVKLLCMLMCSCALLLVLISLLCELLLLWRFLTFRNILHHDDRIQLSNPADLDHENPEHYTHSRTALLSLSRDNGYIFLMCLLIKLPYTEEVILAFRF